MSRRARCCAFVAVLVLSGCFFSNIDFSGRPCDSQLACPEGFVCEPTTRTCARADDLGVGDLEEPVCNDPADAGAQYLIHRLPAGTPINLTSGLCTEPFWSTVPPVAFLGPNATNNTADCRLVWQPGSPDVIFGCCQVGDTDLRGHMTTADSEVYLDDGIEYLLKSNLVAEFDATTSKIQINLDGVYADKNFDGGVQNTLYDAHVISVSKITGTKNDTKPDTGYSIKWRADVGFTVVPPHLGKCDFVLSDLDLDGGVEVRTTWASYGTNDNHPTDWGTCMLSCSTP
jgi:hypothetical protein